MASLPTEPFAAFPSSEDTPLPPAPHVPPGPKLGSALIVCVIFYVATFVILVPVGVVQMLRKQPMDSITMTVLSQLVGWPVTMLAGVLISRRSWRDSFAIGRCPARILPAVIVACFGLGFVLNRLSTLIPMPEYFESMFRDLTKGDPVMIFLCITVLAPLTEELFFRGWMLRGFAAHYSKRKAVWFTAIIFALFHLNPWQAVVALPLGVLFAHWALRTGSLLPGLAGHFAVNFTSVMLMEPIAELFGYSAESLEKARHLPWEMVGFGAVFTVIGFAWLAHELRRTQTVDLSAA